MQTCYKLKRVYPNQNGIVAKIWKA